MIACDIDKWYTPEIALVVYVGKKNRSPEITSWTGMEINVKWMVFSKRRQKYLAGPSLVGMKLLYIMRYFISIVKELCARRRYGYLAWYQLRLYIMILSIAYILWRGNGSENICECRKYFKPSLCKFLELRVGKLSPIGPCETFSEMILMWMPREFFDKTPLNGEVSSCR